jgi:hypothetical protein
MRNNKKIFVRVCLALLSIALTVPSSGLAKGGFGGGRSSSSSFSAPKVSVSKPAAVRPNVSAAPAIKPSAKPSTSIASQPVSKPISKSTVKVAPKSTPKTLKKTKLASSKKHYSSHSSDCDADDMLEGDEDCAQYSNSSQPVGNAQMNSTNSGSGLLLLLVAFGAFGVIGVVALLLFRGVRN